MSELGRKTSTEVVNPDAPVKFLRVLEDGEEVAFIPWAQAERIARAVQRENEDRVQ